MKKAGKNSPGQTSSGKDSHKEEAKTSHHLKTGQEEGDIKDVSNEEKIKDLQNSVTIIGAQLQHIQSEWQAAATVTQEVRDLLQGLKNT